MNMTLQMASPHEYFPLYGPTTNTEGNSLHIWSLFSKWVLQMISPDKYSPPNGRLQKLILKAIFGIQNRLCKQKGVEVH